MKKNEFQPQPQMEFYKGNSLPNLKKCRYCKQLIDKKAKICPYCRKKQSSGCLSVIVFAIIFAIVFSVIVVKMVEPNHSQSGKTSSSVTSTQSSDTEDRFMTESEYKSECESVAYETIARAKDGLKGDKLTFTGQIIQATPGTYRMNVTKGDYFYTDTIIFDIDENILNENILEDDIVTIWGESEGQYTYKAVLGNEITVPKIKVAYIENHGKEN